MPWVKKSFLFRKRKKFPIDDWHTLPESQKNGFPKIIHDSPLSSPCIQQSRLNFGHNDLCNKQAPNSERWRVLYILAVYQLTSILEALSLLWQLSCSILFLSQFNGKNILIFLKRKEHSHKFKHLTLKSTQTSTV